MAQLFGIADTAAALVIVECAGFKALGILWILLGPTAFLIIASHKVRKMVNVDQSLKFNLSPTRSFTEMYGLLKEVPTHYATLSQMFVFYMDLRFVGGWAKTNAEAKFWGFLMGAFSGKFIWILSWVLFKKLWNAFNKNWLDGRANAISNIIVYVVELLLIICNRPFRDNHVNLSTAITSFTNLAGIIIAAAPFMLPSNWLPDVFGPALIITVATVGTLIAALQSILDPIGLALKHANQGASSLIVACGHCSCDIGGVCKTVGQALWTRWQLIFLNRQKAAAARSIAEAKKAKHGSRASGHHHHHLLGNAEFITHRGKVYKKNLSVINPSYNERYLVLHEGVLHWYSIPQIRVDELDQFDFLGSKALGSLSFHKFQKFCQLCWSLN